VIGSRLQQTFVVCLLTVIAFGQTRKAPAKAAPATHKLASIHVSGTQRYKPEEIIVASGLQIGGSATEETFQNAAQRLGECGFFTDVSYGYAATPAGTKLDLVLVDTDKLVPAHFENFVWFSEDELLAKIHERIPLFKGQVPIGGNLADQVSEVLQALLIEHNVSARAEYVRDSKEPDGPIDAINFRATGVTLVVQEIHFTGAGSDELPVLNAAAEKMVGKDYSRADVQKFVTANLLPVYLERGYLKAAIADAQTKVLRDTADSTEVTVQLAVTPGPQYKISNLKWVGNKALPTEKLQPLIHAASGQIANGPQLQDDMEKIHKLYGTLGYMDASVKAQPEFDDAANSVAYTLAVQEGDVFHLGDVDIQGLDAKTTDRLRDAWTLRQTDPYDSSYPMRFFEQTVSMLSRGVTWTVSVHEGVNEEEKTVDVTLRYGLKPSS
jgi:outer membrane protein insertion porin family